MRFYKKKNPINRLAGTDGYKTFPKNYSGLYKNPESEDTRIRREIHRNIIDMMEQGENPIKIECILREKYPDYAQLIASSVNHEFNKRKLKVEDNRIITEGEER